MKFAEWRYRVRPGGGAEKKPANEPSHSLHSQASMEKKSYLHSYDSHLLSKQTRKRFPTRGSLLIAPCGVARVTTLQEKKVFMRRLNLSRKKKKLRIRSFPLPVSLLLCIVITSRMPFLQLFTTPCQRSRDLSVEERGEIFGMRNAVAMAMDPLCNPSVINKKPAFRGDQRKGCAEGQRAAIQTTLEHFAGRDSLGCRAAWIRQHIHITKCISASDQIRISSIKMRVPRSRTLSACTYFLQGRASVCHFGSRSGQDHVPGCSVLCDKKANYK